MICLVLLTLLGGSLADPKDLPNVYSTDLSNPEIWKTLQGPMWQYRWNNFFPNYPEEIQSIHSLEKEIEEQLVKSEKVIGTEAEREKQGTKNFCKLYQRFLSNICSALEDTRKMAEERKLACIGNQQELQDLYNLLSKCAKTRVKLQKEVSVYSEALKRAINMAEHDSSNSKELPQPTLQIPSNQTEPTLKENNQNITQIQEVKSEIKPKEEVKFDIKPKEDMKPDIKPQNEVKTEENKIEVEKKTTQEPKKIDETDPIKLLNEFKKDLQSGAGIAEPKGNITEIKPPKKFSLFYSPNNTTSSKK